MPKTTPNVYQLALQHGFNPYTVYARIRRGMTFEEALSEPLKGSIQQQWRLNREAMIEKGRLSKLKTYIAISPQGKEETITDLPQWCAEKGLNYKSVSTYSRRGKPYKGWTIKKVPSNA
jgi:hypothetical protein